VTDPEPLDAEVPEAVMAVSRAIAPEPLDVDVPDIVAGERIPAGSDPEEFDWPVSVSSPELVMFAEPEEVDRVDGLLSGSKPMISRESLEPEDVDCPDMVAASGVAKVKTKATASLEVVALKVWLPPAVTILV
jgi:hypothetical protein